MKKFQYRTFLKFSEENKLDRERFFLYGKREVLWKKKSLARLCQELGILLEAGIQLVQSLTIIVDGEGWTKWERRDLKKTIELICEGKTFSNALRLQGNVFPEFMIHIIYAAEESGGLDTMCIRLGKHYNRAYRTSEKIRQQLNYPMLVSGLALSLILVFINCVLPQFEDLFSLMEELPLPTRILYGIIGLFQNHGELLGIALLIVSFMTVLFMRLSKVRLCLDRIKLKMPIMRKILQTFYTAQFAYTLNFLHCAGIPLDRGIEIAGKTIGNRWLEVQLEQAIIKLRTGIPLSEVIGEIEGFHRSFASIILVGEESGNLPEMLESVTETSTYETELAMEQAVALLEPTLIIIVSTMIGFIVLAIMMPIYGSYAAMELLM